MCGIVGAVTRPDRFSHDDMERAALSLRHRGPDDLGVEKVASTGAWDVWFAQTRLSIIDLSSAGHQPMRMSLPDGRAGAIVFNGEVYNHRALRRELSPRHELRSTSDTEVLLAGLLGEGPDFLTRTNGMLAAAFWNASTRTLLLARDRLGKKPLYVYQGPDMLLFASELKAFHALGVSLTESAESWARYHWLRHIPGERTIYRECRKLPAASHVTVDLSTDQLPRLSPRLFWDPLAALGRSFPGTYDDAVDAFLDLLDDATRARLDADVPVGVFLSGGIDSSLVAASVAANHGASTTAFIVKAADASLDESAVAMRTAAKLGLDAHVLRLELADYERQTRDIAFYYDEPCAPLSQIPTMAIAEAARRHVTVALTGDGGDEVFLGYPWLGYPERLFRYRRPLDLIPGARRIAGYILPSRVGITALDCAAMALGFNRNNLGIKQRIAVDILRADRPTELYDHFQQLWPRAALPKDEAALLGPEGLLARAKHAYPAYSWEAAEARSVPELLGALEMVTSMRDEILVKVDRGTMAYSLEARSPLLDHRIVEFGLSLPLSFKVHEGVYKRVLRDACARRVDPELARLKKSGFGIPAPANMPAGPSIPVRWARAVEESWRARWGRLAVHSAGAHP